MSFPVVDVGECLVTVQDVEETGVVVIVVGCVIVVIVIIISA